MNIKPCPACGAEAYLNADEDIYNVECVNRTCPLMMAGRNTAKQAIDAWNAFPRWDWHPISEPAPEDVRGVVLDSRGKPTSCAHLLLLRRGTNEMCVVLCDVGARWTRIGLGDFSHWCELPEPPKEPNA